jgi:hypothetical protein
MKNTIKIVLLGVIGFSLLVYLTVPKNLGNNSSVQNMNLTINSLPRFFDIVGGNPYTKFEEHFRSGEEKYIIFLNHDALAVFKDLYKKTNKNIVFVANISNTPWLIKQIAVNGELEKMYKNSKIALINDSDGMFVNSLGLNDNQQNKYFIYKLNSDETITKIKESTVKLGALEKGLTPDELESTLNEIVKNFN